MKFLKSAIITFVSNVLIFVVAVVSTFAVSKLLGAEGKGIVTLANTVISICTIFFGMGIGAANVYFIGRHRDKLNEVISGNIILSAATFAIMALLFVINNYAGLDFLFKNLSAQIIILTIVSVPFLNLKGAFIGIIQGQTDFKKYNLMNILDTVVTFGYLLLVLIFMNSAFWIVFSTCISGFTMLVILVYTIYKGKKFRFVYDRHLVKHMFFYGNKVQIGNAVQFLNYRLDTLIINMFLGAAQVGIYSVAVALAETMWKVSSSVSTVILPVTAGSSDPKQLAKFISKVSRVTVFILFIGSIPLMIISGPVMGYLGRDFTEGFIPLALLIPGILVFSMCSVLASYFAGIGKIEKNITASAAACIITVILDLILIPLMGIKGASVATSLSYFTATAITVYYFHKETGCSIRDTVLINKDDISEIKNTVKRIVFKR